MSEDSTQSPASPPSPKRLRPVVRYLMLFLMVLFGVGVTAAVGWYKAEVTGFWTQQGWNAGAAAGTVRQFLSLAADPSGGAAAVELLDPDVYTPEISDGRLVSLTYSIGMGNATADAEEFLPGSEIKSTHTRLMLGLKSIILVQVELEDGRWGEYTVHRQDGKRRLTDLAVNFYDERPATQ